MPSGWVVLLAPVTLLAALASGQATEAAATPPDGLTANPAAATWSRATIPEPSGTFSGKLLGTSCDSPTDCVAVGWGSTTGSPIGTLVEHWDGAAWSPVASPNPSDPGDAFPQLNGVSCLTAAACTAVGTDLTTSNGSNTVVESYNGASWSVVPSPDVSGATNSTLSGVSCKSLTLCMAVGNSVTTSPNVQTLIEQWNGTTWSIDPSPNVSGALQTWLTSVSCPTLNECEAVGYSLASSGTEPVVEQWNGTTWTMDTPAVPPGSADNELSGVACPQRGNCIAVGRTYATGSSPAAALAEQWNGSTWSVVPTPNPSGVLGDFLVSVSCYSAAGCVAAGESYLDNSGDSQTLVERLSKGTWVVEPSPNAPGTTTSLLSGVGCPVGSTSCVAVGQSYTPDEDSLLALAHQAGPWKLTPVTGPSTPARSSLQSVGCSTTTCAAVGSAFPTNSFDRNGFIEQWNGTDWTLGTSAEPAGAVVTDLNGAACPTSTACTAVGDVGIGTTGQDGQVSAYAESWNGATWSVMATPDPPGATYVSLTSVSCSSPTNCTAGGYSEATPGGARTAVVERMVGTTWTLQALATPPGATATSLEGVACATAKVCTAVGSFVDSSSVTETLVEQWNGTTWSVTSSPDVAGAAANDLLGVSCLGTATCVAVGYSESGGGEQSSLAERLTTGVWTIETTPNVTGAFSTVLSGVACVKTAPCKASGYSENGSGDTTLVVSGFANWSVVKSATIAGDYSTGLNGVACTSTTFCAAAGSGPDGFGEDDGLVEQS